MDVPENVCDGLFVAGGNGAAASIVRAANIATGAANDAAKKSKSSIPTVGGIISPLASPFRP